jgi:transposase
MPKNRVQANPDRVVVQVTGGVDTHGRSHTVAAVDQLGGLLGWAEFPATADGYRQLEGWLRGWGPVGRVGVEGTGCYGAGLTRHLTGAGVEVVEVNRPNRADRRARGKSDPIDAENAARAVLAGTATAAPKSRDGIVEAIRVLQVAREGAVKARTAALNEFAGLLVTAPEPVRASLTGLSVGKRITAAAGYRPGPGLADPTTATKTALRRLARRIQVLDGEIADAAAELDTLTVQANPGLRAEFGVGPLAAARLLITAGDNPHRLGSEAAFAAVCGTNPVPASSGQTIRHRLNRGGDRQANRALYTIVLTRMRYHEPTKAYVARARARGKTTKETIRLLKRHLARRIHHLLTAAEAPRVRAGQAPACPQLAWPGPQRLQGQGRPQAVACDRAATLEAGGAAPYAARRQPQPAP